MAEITYLEGILQAQVEEMERDPRVIMLGEDISLYGSSPEFATIAKNRIRSTPISENSFTGMAIGAALTGLRPIVDLTIASFVYLAADQLINQAAKLYYMSNGRTPVPIVVRASMWHNGANAAQHSDRPYPMFMNVPGLKVLTPATAAEAKGLLKAAVREDGPVLIFEDNDLWMHREEVPDDKDFLLSTNTAVVQRQGSDVTIIAIAGTLAIALAAAENLSTENISAEVISPRCLSPLDKETLVSAVQRTGHVVVVDYAHHNNGAAAEIVATVTEGAFSQLKASPKRVTTPDIPIPFSPSLEQHLYPTSTRVEEAVRAVLHKS